MTLEQYSVFLTFALGALSLAVVVSVLAYLFSKQAREHLHEVGYFTYIKLIGLFAIIATVGALVYQFVYQTPVCEYCWWQRIFMFPIDIIALTTVWYQTKNNETSIGILAAIGAVFAAVHYYFHVQVAVLGNILSLPCSSVGIIPSCTETPVLIFGFVTIPLMALIVFVTILWLVFLARKAG